MPVLFWCFVAMWILEKIQICDKIKLLLLLLIAITPCPYIPFQLYRVPYYLLFFFAGYKVWQHGENFRLSVNSKNVMGFWSIFAIIFIGFRILMANLAGFMELAPLLSKLVFKTISTACKITYSSLGVIAIYTTAIWFTKSHQLYKWYINIGSLCFGVYVFQEFIIKYIYYYTELPVIAGYIALPWITFMITLTLSLLLTKTAKSL